MSHSKRKPVSSFIGRNPSGPWKEPTFGFPTAGDQVDGEDLAVRRAAVEALGAYNGTVVVSDASNGRILSIVNQKLAMKGGYQPCSTIKLVTAIAAMSEGIISRDGDFRISRTNKMDLSAALAHSNNSYFATLGQKLGFERVSRYAHMLGLGEKAAWNLTAEETGTLPSAPPKNGGVGMMTSFGEGIRLTPLQLASLLGAIANGGTLYELQYPRNAVENMQFQSASSAISRSPVRERPEAGHARSDHVRHCAPRQRLDRRPGLRQDGTCTDYQQSAHMGWFGSFNEVRGRKLVVVVMLTGGKAVSGPVASGVAGSVYKNLADGNYLASTPGLLSKYAEDSVASDFNWSFRRQVLYPALTRSEFLLLALAPALSAADLITVRLRPETAAAFNDYVRKAEARMDAEIREGRFLWLEQREERLQQARAGRAVIDPWEGKVSRDISSGIIHDWIGAALIPESR